VNKVVCVICFLFILYLHTHTCHTVYTAEEYNYKRHRILLNFYAPASPDRP